MMQVIDQVREHLRQTPCHDIRIKFKVLSKKTIKTPEPRQCRRSGVFIVYSEYISHPFLKFFFLIFFSINLTNIHCTNQHRCFVKITNRLKCYKLKLLPDTYKVSG